MKKKQELSAFQFSLLKEIVEARVHLGISSYMADNRMTRDLRYLIDTEFVITGDDGEHILFNPTDKGLRAVAM